MKSKLASGVEIWARNREAEEEHKQEMLKNLKKRNQSKRNFVLEPMQLNEVLDDLDIPLF